MKNLKLFTTETLQDQFRNSDLYIKDHVSFGEDNNIVKYDKYIPLIGDYLLSDLKTIVKNSELKDTLKTDVVGICIGLNKATGKSTFWNIDSMTNTTTYKFYTSNKFDTLSTYTVEQDSTVDDSKISEMILSGTDGKIAASRDFSVTTGDYIFPYNDFGGLLNTKEWYKQCTANGIDVTTKMPALWKVINGYGGFKTTDNIDNYNSWYLGGLGCNTLLVPTYNFGTASENYTAISNAVTKLGKTYNLSWYWGSTFTYLDDSYSRVHDLRFYSDRQYWDGGDSVNDDNSVFACIDI